MTNVTLNNRVLSHNGFIAEVIKKSWGANPPISQIEADFKRLSERFLLECTKCCIDIQSYRKGSFTLKENATRLIGMSNKKHSIDVFTNINTYPFTKQGGLLDKYSQFCELREIVLDAIMKMLDTGHISQLLTQYHQGKASFTFDIQFQGANDE